MARNRFIFIILIISALGLLASCSSKRGATEVYSFSGENEYIAVDNGIIIVTGEMEKFIGGDLRFIGEELSGIKNSNAKFYFFKDNYEVTIQSSSDIIEGSDNAVIQSDLGTSSSKDLFYGDDLELIKESLNFTLSGSLVTGEVFEYKMALEVKKVY